MWGIPNLGNTCYIGSIVQCLGHCPSFFTYMTRTDRPQHVEPGIVPEHSAALAIRSRKQAIRAHAVHPSRYPSVAESLRELYRAMCDRDSRRDEIRTCTVHLYRALQEAFPTWPVRQQNDAQELFMLLSERLIQETGRELGGSRHAEKFASYPAFSTLPVLYEDNPRVQSVYDPNVLHAVRASERALFKKGATHWAESQKKNYGALSEMFQGQYVSQVLCGNCGATYHNFEVLDAIPISMMSTTAKAPEAAARLSTCLKGFFGDEQLEGWKCDACGHRSSPGTVKTYRCWKAPRILIVFVKRFCYATQRKDRRPLLLGDGTVNMSAYSSGPLARRAKRENAHVYALRSAVCHSGNTMDSGHYYTVARKMSDSTTKNDNETWCMYDDDDAIRPCSGVPEKDVYMLAFECT